MIESLEDNALTELLSSFSCEKDSDIESFLHNRAVEFENLSKARTYLVFDVADFENGKDMKLFIVLTARKSLVKVKEEANYRGTEEEVGRRDRGDTEWTLLL